MDRGQMRDDGYIRDTGYMRDDGYIGQLDIGMVRV